jgi:hypothetical protein
MLLRNRLIIAIGVFFVALTESFALPVIAFHPQDTSVELGGTATLFIRYPRSTNPSVQWQFNGIELPGATNRDLIISEAGFSDVGTYRAVLKDGDGSITSEGAILNIPGLDTKVTRYATNPPGGAVELWTIEGERHSPTFASGGTWSQFPEKTVDWLLAHPKP